MNSQRTRIVTATLNAATMTHFMVVNSGFSSLTINVVNPASQTYYATKTTVRIVLKVAIAAVMLARAVADSATGIAI
jgi:hypothetical protein